MTSGSEKRNRVRVEESEKQTVDETLVGSERWVVKPPVLQIIGGTVAIPFSNWKVKGNFHPMPLSFIVPKLWRVSSTRIRME